MKRSTLTGIVVLACALALAALPATAELRRLGTKQFTCKKGDVRFHGAAGSKYYPAGKREKIRIPTKTGILAYTCRYVRQIISCPMGTRVVTVKRSLSGGRFDAECLGEIKAGPLDLIGTEPDATGAAPGRPESGEP